MPECSDFSPDNLAGKKIAVGHNTNQVCFGTQCARSPNNLQLSGLSSNNFLIAARAAILPSLACCRSWLISSSDRIRFGTIDLSVFCIVTTALSPFSSVMLMKSCGSQCHLGQGFGLSTIISQLGCNLDVTSLFFFLSTTVILPLGMYEIHFLSSLLSLRPSANVEFFAPWTDFQ